MQSTLLLRYQQPIDAVVDKCPVPSGTATMTKVHQESGDTDCSLAMAAGSTHGTGTFTSTKTEAPDRDYLSAGIDFVFPR